jgi:hypothetical protein
MRTLAIGSTLGVTALVVAARLADLGGSASGTAVAAPRTQPPAAVQEAAAPLGCAALTWTAWSGGWWADCARTETTRRDGEVTIHRYLAFHRRPDGQFAMEDLVETHDSNSLRVKVPRHEKVSLRDGRATYEAHTESGYIHRRVWDLSTNPASLLEDREGGGKICEDGFANASSSLVGPVCSTDFAQQRQSCTAERPNCARDPVKVAPVRYTAIPLHNAAASLRDPDLFHCATTIGARPEDVLSGKNIGRAKFQVVAVDDAAAKTLALHLRVADPTPQPVTGDDWQVHDHWELWLANPYNELTCDDTANLASYCQQAKASLQTLEIIIAPAADGTWKLRAATPSPPAAWTSEVHARSDGVDLIVELGGSLRDWARDGGLTLVYGDSTAGTKQDCQLATSPVQADRADTLGRLGNTLLCDRADGTTRP